MTNKKSTKKALLTSALSLLLCLSMLIGTTFAWFTDSVESGTNIIAAGNLDIELYHSDKAVKDEKVNGGTKLFDDVMPSLWEPGAVAYEVLTVKNEGTLALKYNLAVMFKNATVVNGKSLADALWVAVVDAAELSDRESAIAAGEGKWQNLADFNLPGTLEAGKAETYGIVIYWLPTANDNDFNMNNENKGKELSIELGVHLTATQLMSENDSYGDDYDKDASITVSNFAELVTAVANVKKGGTIYVEPGIVEFEYVITVSGKEFTIEGLGNVLFKNVASTANHFFNLTEESNVIFRNIDMDGNKLDANNVEHGKNGIFVRYNSTATLDNCKIYNTRGSSICVDQVSDKLSVVNGTAYVNLINGTEVESISACAFPTNGHAYDSVTRENSYVKVTTDATSTIDSFKKDSWAAAENITLNDATAIVTTYAELKAAVEAAEDGDTIFINSGVYEMQQITVNNKSLEFVGIGNVILNGTANNVRVFQLRNGAEGSTPVEDMTVTFKNLTIGGTYQNGIIVRNDLNVNLEDVTFTGSYKWAPLQVENSYDTESKFDGVVTVNAKNVTADKVTMAADDGRATCFNYEDCNFGMIEVQDLGGKVVLNGTETGKGFTYWVNDAAELQSALDAATNDTIIYLGSDITGDVTATQKTGVNIIIDGNNFTYNGTIFVSGQSNGEGAETLTIQNINFVSSTASTASIDAYWGTANETRYAHNVTVNGCTFTMTGDAKYTSPAVDLYQPYNFTMENCVVTGAHSVLQNKGGHNGITVEKVMATDCKSGISVGTMDGAISISNCKLDVSVYGIRVDASVTSAGITISDCEISAYIPVTIRKASGTCTVTFNGANTMTATNEEGLWCTIGKEEYGDVVKAGLNSAGGEIDIVLNDAGLATSGVYNAN